MLESFFCIHAIVRRGCVLIPFFGFRIHAVMNDVFL
jgi:hypothetical protein